MYRLKRLYMTLTGMNTGYAVIKYGENMEIMTNLLNSLAFWFTVPIRGQAPAIRVCITDDWFRITIFW